MMWKPIESAPKDGTVVLGWPCTGRYNRDYPAPMVWERGDEAWFFAAADYGEFYNVNNSDAPTHWMPLPTPPEAP